MIDAILWIAFMLMAILALLAVLGLFSTALPIRH
jgi:hypothetical protein